MSSLSLAFQRDTHPRLDVSNDHPSGIEYREEHAVKAIRIWIGSSRNERRCVQNLNLHLVRHYRGPIFALSVSHLHNLAFSTAHSLCNDCEIDLTQLMSVTSAVFLSDRPCRRTRRHLAYSLASFRLATVTTPQYRSVWRKQGNLQGCSVLTDTLQSSAVLGL